MENSDEIERIRQSVTMRDLLDDLRMSRMTLGMAVEHRNPIVIGRIVLGVYDALVQRRIECHCNGRLSASAQSPIEAARYAAKSAMQEAA